ncbi:aspartate aminotransferase family protein [Noviluteimonas gilva]|uniref:Aminotransferase class III-fold pyridoxal phosphate-dependent enzyme n=1 Tax=Noviluteimonas gilva TaxID=2682097 RepID=A0A7C9HRF5_9GAMM|nr:aminotransferase class III-fold pyridoxal phosphate-dependent enzyme [Lysobacter gilvus]MUV13631.1 aminotransferase class III-fold pyridoxal phosphate-dependent enzyme [Lysobacter gilvus]
MSIDERQSVLHSWSVQADWRAPTVVGGQGARLHLADGRSVLDMSSLAECSNLGHQHPKLVAAIRAQAERLCFVSNAWGAEPRAQLAAMLLERSGFEGGRVFFTLGGADANENAVKIARQVSRKPRGAVIARDRSYHGATHLAMALSGDSRTQQQVDAAAFGVQHVPPPYAYRCPFGSRDADECGLRAADAVAQRIDALGANSVAAVLMEPNAGTNGIVAPDTYWPALRRATADRGVVLIADEVMSAFGRCGEWFAWQRQGESGRPDMMTLAKGLTGAAVPLGAVVLSRDVAMRLEHEMLYTGLTYCGHPLACAAGVAALEAYAEDGLIERSRKLGAKLFAQAKRLQERHDVIGDVRGGHGLFVVIELVADRDSRAPLAPWPQTPPALKALVDAAMAEGVSFATRGNLILLAPPLVIDENELADAVALLDRLLARHFAPAEVSQ